MGEAQRQGSPGSQIALWSSWRGCGGGLQLFDELRSAGQKERQKSSSAEALELMVQQRPAERCCQSLHADRLQVAIRAATAAWNQLNRWIERPRHRAAVSEPSGSAAAARRPASLGSCSWNTLCWTPPMSGGDGLPPSSSGIAGRPEEASKQYPGEAPYTNRGLRHVGEAPLTNRGTAT